ncbi:AraC family transcriptional regulator, partial [Bordetella pertussis]
MSALPDSPSASPPPRHDELASLIERHTPADGSTATALPGLNFYRSSSPTELNVSFYRPSLALLAQGAKRVQLG